MTKALPFFLICWLSWISLYGQTPPISFRHLTVADGLHDGHIQMIGQDKWGYMWFGSLGALNRYDGQKIRTYAYRSGNNHSPLSGIVYSMVTDGSGRLFFGFDSGLAELNYAKNNFNRIETFNGLTIYRMIAMGKDIFMMTDKGLIKYTPLSNKTVRYGEKDSLLAAPLTEAVLKDNRLYIGSDQGIIVFDCGTEKAWKLPLSIKTASIGNLSIGSLGFDEQNRLWLTTLSMPKVVRLTADFQDLEVYDAPLLTLDPALSREYFVLKDKKNGIWISTKHIGLLQYLPETNGFKQYVLDEQKTWTPSCNVHLSIFCDKEGTIWLGGNEGINYFHPERNLFETILPFGKDFGIRSRRWARSVVEDKDKNLWFGAVDGVSKYDIKTKTYREWRNELNKPPVIAYNSIRQVISDNQDNIWVVTSKGLNRYDTQTSKMLFFDKQLPKLSYMRLFKDRNNQFWFSTIDGDGYYQFDPQTLTLKSISEHPYLKRFVGLEGWSFLHDSKGRYWLGFSEKGLGMYDPNTQKTYHWKSNGVNSIAGNLVMSIKEDLNGHIWIATSHGVTEINVETNLFKTYNTDNGLCSNSASCLAVDALNRIWIGTTRGLMLLDSSRQSFTHFGLQDGLPTLAFTEHESYTTSSGDIIMPTQKGYIRFNPLNYTTEKRKLNCYISHFSAANVEKQLVEDDGGAHIAIKLQPHENSISLNLVALNYFNPSQTWFAYKLDGFDTEWHITQDPKVVYTNLSGGNYTFRYKASLNVNDWQVEEKTIDVHVDVVFYKSFWFWALWFALFGGLVYAYWRNRNEQRERLADLQRKAQLLEKEKSVMQYEGLKQQLNPHFLFNSLTSLSSLIQIDSKIANDFLESLSKTYRYILKSSESETVQLSDEIKFAENFVKLQKTRFEEGLIVNITVSEMALQQKIVPVTLQNLIENAMKHNIIDSETPLVIDIFTENTVQRTPTGEGGQTLIVRNNLQKKNFVATSNKRGLVNFVNLYRYLTNTPVEIIENDTHFIVKIPLL
ncbi:MAG: histidine kinase [Saprospiraceae bacterium]|nr:histidine kinase [Saprospiraceae bacterium]